MVKFFDKEEEEQIISAIQAAELQTSGEIRVHLIKKKKADLKNALHIFRSLGMDKTEQRNGVLILVAPNARQFAIIGDEGINRVVPDGFWEEERNIMQEHFRNQEYGKGVSTVIGQIGEKLKTYFPRREDDINELPDEISYED